MRHIGTVHTRRTHGVLHQCMGVHRHTGTALLDTPGMIQNRLKIKLDGHVVAGEQEPQILNKILVAYKCHAITATPLVEKPECYGLDVDTRPDGRIEQAGMKRRDIKPGRGRAFREQTDHFAPCKTLLHLLTNRPHGMTLATFDEHRTRTGHKPADHWPAADVAFGNEGGWAHRIEYKDIDPGHMVRHPEHRTCVGRVPCQAHVHTTQHHERT